MDRAHKIETRNGRGHAAVVDYPPTGGGTDEGPTALELSVMALAGCVTTIFTTGAEKRKLAVKGLAVQLKAHRAAEGPPFSHITGRVEVRTEAFRREVETVLRLTLPRCPVGILFEGAGAEIDWKLEVVESRQQ